MKQNSVGWGNRSDRAAGRAVALAAIVLLLLGGLVPPASAQDDPYGSTTTTAPPPSAGATCTLSATEGRAGSPVTATVSGAAGTVRVLFGGIDVGRAVNGADGPALAIPFVVPSVLPGTYLVTATGPDFTVECNTEVDGMFTVLGSAATANEGGGGGALPRTGIAVALLLLLAIALLVGGRLALDASRRRAARHA